MSSLWMNLISFLCLEEEASEAGDTEDGEAQAQGFWRWRTCFRQRLCGLVKDLKEFKDSVKNEGGEGILKIGQGETVTIRVPTHPEGNYLFWEFGHGQLRPGIWIVLRME